MLILLSFLVGCASNTLGTDAATQIDTIRNLAENHVDSVSSMSEISDIAALEATYDSEWTVVMSDMSGQMDDMMSCMGMDGDGMGSDTDTTWMTDMSEHLVDMDAEHDDHGDHMAFCADIGECLDEENEHLDAVTAHLDAMNTGLDSWDADMKCPDEQ